MEHLSALERHAVEMGIEWRKMEKSGEPDWDQWEHSFWRAIDEIIRIRKRQYEKDSQKGPPMRGDVKQNRDDE